MYFLLNSPFLGDMLVFREFISWTCFQLQGYLVSTPTPTESECSTSITAVHLTIQVWARWHIAQGNTCRFNVLVKDLFIRQACTLKKGDLKKRQWQNTDHPCMVHFTPSSLVIWSSWFMKDGGSRLNTPGMIMNDMEMTIAQMFHLCNIYLFWQ